MIAILKFYSPPHTTKRQVSIVHYITWHGARGNEKNREKTNTATKRAAILGRGKAPSV